MTTKEVHLITEYFYPDTAATGQLMTDLATGLQNRGIDVAVYTGQPNYHSGGNDPQPRTSYYGGVLVKRIRAPQLRQSSFHRRLFNWTIFTVWMFFALLFSRREGNRQLLFVSNPPFLPLVLWLVCKVRGWEYTFIIHDVYPDMAIAPGHIAQDGLISRSWSRLNKHIFRDAKHVVVLGAAMKDKVVKYTGPEKFDESKIEIIHNWADEEFIKPLEKEENWFAKEHGLLDRFTVLYSGNIGDNHDLATLIRAAKEFEEEDVVFLVIGEGDKKRAIQELADDLGLSEDTVVFLPYQDREDLPYTLTAGDVTVVSVSEGMKGVCVSSKLYTSLAAGDPVLVISHPEDDEARIVKEHDAGKQVRQGDVEGVVEAIEEWRSDPELVEEQGANARKAFLNNFTKRQSIDEYYRLLAEE